MANRKSLVVNRLGAEILVKHLARRDAPWLPLLPRESSHSGNIWLARQSSTVVTYGDAAGSSDAERQASARATARLVTLGLLQRSGRKYCDVITPAGERYARGVGWPFLASQAAEALARLSALTDAGDCTYQNSGGRWDKHDAAGAAHDLQGFVYASLIAGSASPNALDCLDVCLIPFVRAGFVDATANGRYYRLTGDAVTAEQVAAIVAADAERAYDDELGGVYFEQLAISRQRILDEPQEINELGGFSWNVGIMGSSRKADDFRGAKPIFPKPMPGETKSPSGNVAA